MTSVMPLLTILKETEITMDQHIGHQVVTKMLYKVTGRGVMSGTGLLAQQAASWLIQLYLPAIVEHLLQDG